MNFVEHLPLGAGAAAIDAAACHQALRQVSLGAPAPAAASAAEAPAPVGDEAWARLALQSLEAYREDLAKSPETWDEVKIYLEKYLKPLLFAHIGGIVDDQELARGAIAFVFVARRGIRLRAGRCPCRGFGRRLARLRSCRPSAARPAPAQGRNKLAKFS